MCRTRRPLRRVDRIARRVAAAAVLVAIGVGAVAPAAAQERMLGNVVVPVPPPTEAGEWSGTWYYVSKLAKVALWMRGKRGKPEVRLRYLNVNTGEGFETNWRTVAEYVHRERLGTFELRPTLRSADRIEGDWVWRLANDRMARDETARVRIHRTADGRQLVMVFEGLERIHHDEGLPDRKLAYKQVWLFHKASNGVALWDELPF